MKNQYAQDLMNRQRQQDALDKAAAKAQKDAIAGRAQYTTDVSSIKKQLGVLENHAVNMAKQASQNTPSVGIPSGQDLITRMKKITIPGEEPSPEELKRAGDFTQAPLSKLQALAKFGDKLAQNELNRRLKN